MNPTYDPSQDIPNDIIADNKFFQDNYGKGKLFPSGPDCSFRGKNITNNG